MLGVRTSDEGRQMQHCVASRHGFLDTVRVADVAEKYIQIIADVLGSVIKPSPRVERVVKHEGPDTVSLANQEFCEMRTDEGISTGDGDILFHQFKSIQPILKSPFAMQASLLACHLKPLYPVPIGISGRSGQQWKACAQ
jgi:hypothetical protein